MTKSLTSILSCLSLIIAATSLRGEEMPRLTVFMVGDSTMANYPLKSPSPDPRLGANAAAVSHTQRHRQ